MDLKKLLTHQLNRRWLSGALIALAAILTLRIGLAEDVTAQGNNLHMKVVGVDSQSFPEVSLTLAVWDQEEVPADLVAENFQVSEEGLAFPVDAGLTLTPASLPGLHLVLVLDVTMPENDLARLKEAAQSLIDRLGPADKIALIRLGDRGMLVHPFTNNTQALETAVTDLPGGGTQTALNEAIKQAATELEQITAAHRAVVIITDRHDNAHTVSLDEALGQAQKVGAPFYIIGFGDKVRQDHPIKTGIQLTGGRYLAVDDVSQAGATLLSLEEDLRQGYRLTFRSRLKADNLEHDLQLVLTYGGQRSESTARFKALPRPVMVRLPDLGPKPLARGVISIKPEIEAPAPPVSVTYLLGDQILAELNGPSYSYKWDTGPLGAGPFTLTVRAIDSAGNTGAAQTRVDLAPPLSLVLSGLPGEPIPYGQTVTLVISLSALENEDLPPGDTVETEVYLNERILVKPATLPYSLTLNTRDANHFPPGEHTLMIRVKDRLEQTDEAIFPINILPQPRSLNWLERLAQRLGFESYPTFTTWLNRSFDLFVISITGLLLLTILLMALLGWRKLKEFHCRKSRQTCIVEIINEGNTPSRYELWAEEYSGQLNFWFTLNGASLPQRLEVQPFETPEAAGAEDAILASSPPLPSSVSSSPAPDSHSAANLQERLRQAGTTGHQAQSYLGTTASISRSLATFLPRPLNQPFLQLSGQLTARQNALRQMSQLPKQMTRQGDRLRQQLSPLVGSGSKESTITAGVVSAEQHRETAAASKPASPGRRPAPNLRRTQSQVNGNGPYIAASPALTPPLEPGDRLWVELQIIPTDPYHPQTYLFTLGSHVVEQSHRQPRRDIKMAEIIGVSRLRYLMLSWGLPFLIGLVTLGLAYLAYHWLYFDIVSWLTALS